MELLQVRLVINAALTEGEGAVNDVVCDLCDGFLVEACRTWPGPPTRNSSDQP